LRKLSDNMVTVKDALQHRYSSPLAREIVAYLYIFRKSKISSESILNLCETTHLRGGKNVRYTIRSIETCLHQLAERGDVLEISDTSGKAGRPCKFYAISEACVKVLEDYLTPKTVDIYTISQGIE
jgi:hypothetical protein